MMAREYNISARDFILIKDMPGYNFTIPKSFHFTEGGET